jgi:serine/threonine protein phosphatase PrpC
MGITENRENVEFEIGQASDVGVVRSENQDYVEYFEAADKKWTLLVVCDGMGGHAGGQRASELCAKLIGEQFAVRFAVAEPGIALTQAIQEANSAIFSLGKESSELKGMGTTCAVFAIAGATGYFAHVGDSRIYRVRWGSIELLTKDHSAVQRLVDGGFLTAEQAANHPNSNVLTRCIGGADNVDPDIRGPEEILPGDRFVLCSDGLWSQVQAKEIGGMVSAFRPQDAAERLIRLAKSRGGPDNISVQIFHLEDGRPVTALYSPESFRFKSFDEGFRSSSCSKKKVSKEGKSITRRLFAYKAAGVGILVGCITGAWLWWSQRNKSSVLTLDKLTNDSRSADDSRVDFSNVGNSIYLKDRK